jgi:hypothetical protein
MIRLRGSWGVRTAAVLVVTFGALVAPASPAAAAIGLTCVSDTDVTYHPGLHLTPQDQNIKVDGQLSPCAGDPSITAGSYAAHLHAVRSCADLLTSTTGTFTIQWNGGTAGFSTISFSRTATIVGGNIVTTEVGTVVAGDFTGAATTFVTTGPNNLLLCNTTEGLRDVHTNGNLTISPSV